MPASYSYIDVATLDAVRQRFAAADALAILSADLGQIIWVNGPGAEMLGYGDIGTALGAASRLGFAAKRQITATSGFPDIGADRALGVRLTSGMTSRVAALLASAVELPDGEKAIMLAASAPQAASSDRRDLARRAISGFSEPGQFTALLGTEGAVEAASEGFDRLGISGETLARLVADAQDERDRTARRTVEAGRRSLPAGLARLTDDPARYLLVVIDEGVDVIAEEPALEPAAETPPAELTTEIPAVGDEPTNATAAETSVDIPAAASADVNDDASNGLVEFVDAEDGFEETATSSRPAEQDNRPHQHDEWYFSGNEEAAAPDSPADNASENDSGRDDHATSEAMRPAIDKAAAPVRFVWRTDADGRFSTISPEFAAAVGTAADVVGRSFGEVAAAFRLDPDGEIASLLERRDTWSGRSVLWPIADTDLKVPVDLAALPAYSRDRKFEGFRGFGVARTGDAIVDAEAVGLNLAGAFAASATPAPTPEGTVEPAQTEEPTTGPKPVDERPAEAKPPTDDAGKPADPFKGEVPVLSIVPKPDRRFSDKVIRLAEHRAPANDKSLSSVERNAFREIGERLRKDSAPSQPGGTQAPVVETPGAADTVAAQGDAANVEGEATSFATAAPLAESTATSAERTLHESGTVQAEAPTDEAADEETTVVGEDELSEAPVEAVPAMDDFAAPVEDDEPVLVDEGNDAETLDDLAVLDGVETAEAISDTFDVTDTSDEEATSEPTVDSHEQSVPAGETMDRADEQSSADTDLRAVQDDGMPASEGQPVETTIGAPTGPDKTAEPAPARPRRGGSLLDFMERSPTASSPQLDATAVEPKQPGATEQQAVSVPLAIGGEENEDAETTAYAEAETAAHEAEALPLTAEDATATEPPALEAANLPERSDLDPVDLVAAETPDETYHIEAVVPEEDAGAAEHAIAGHTHLHADNDESFVPAGGIEEASSLAAADEAADLDKIELPDETGGDNDETAIDTDAAAAVDTDDAEAEDHGEVPHRAGADTSILDKLPVPVLIHAGDTLHHANAEFLALTGYDDLQALDADGGLGALFAASDEEHVEGSDRQMRLTRRDGIEVPVDAHLRSVPWGDGKALMLVVTPRPGEAREAPLPNQPAVSDLQTRIAEMRTIIDTATDGVVLMARDGTIRSISRPAEALFGFDSDEVAGKPFASLFAIESQRAARDYLNGLSDHGVASVLNDGREVIGRESQGRFIPLFMTIGRLPGDTGYCAVVRDITQWKRAEEELTQARAMAERASSQKSDFLARVSHEIRTPLNAIIGFSELMIDEKFGPVANDRYRDYLRDINRSGNHVLDLVNDLLDISKIEAGQQEMSYEAVSLNDTLAETVAMMQPQANRERVIIRSSFASKLPEVVADLRSVRQIALNILSNAVRYTQAGGQVIVSTAYEASGDVVMRVRDTGIGMSHAEIEQALKPFKQINALKRGRNDGTGLGLPLTKAMVEANRAKFSILSTPGEGTLVEITFPSTRVLAE